MVSAREVAYHSKTVPSDAAKSSFDSTVRIVGNASAVINGKERVSIVHSSIPMRAQKLTAAALSKWDPQGWFYRHLTIRLPPDNSNLVSLERRQSGV